MLLAALYFLFALVAIVVNIGVQDASLYLYAEEGGVWISVILGTMAGLFVKYILDKRYIFVFYTKDVIQNARMFVLYAGMGLMTTGIFWGCEFAFHVWFDGARNMRYLGAVIGLMFGYFVKYHLDKKYVFTKRSM